MEEDILLVCRKTGKTGEDSNPANYADLLLLAFTTLSTAVLAKEKCFAEVAG